MKQSKPAVGYGHTKVACRLLKLFLNNALYVLQSTLNGSEFSVWVWAIYRYTFKAL